MVLTFNAELLLVGLLAVYAVRALSAQRTIKNDKRRSSAVAEKPRVVRSYLKIWLHMLM